MLLIFQACVWLFSQLFIDFKEWVNFCIHIFTNNLSSMQVRFKIIRSALCFSCLPVCSIKQTLNLESEYISTCWPLWLHSSASLWWTFSLPNLGSNGRKESKGPFGSMFKHSRGCIHWFKCVLGTLLIVNFFFLISGEASWWQWLARPSGASSLFLCSCVLFQCQVPYPCPR